ncbi:ExbD/TolR family protein [Gelidibacter japonicus]|uniref:ExbD/TolR family protein n=1 Tax=Gelidibacter japonicus TaxID=1962232 RepID=UPI0013D69ADA|nr:biopolymer transporter ExbD [Gelidibacter japonicus]
MAKFNKKKSGDLPAISTASLPDIVFMLLFFFMVATTMRETTLKIENKLPYADQVEKLDKKDLIMYIYIGKPQEAFQGQYGKESRIQLNDKFADLVDIKSFIAAERASKREELVPFLTVALKVDENANMGLVSDVKRELRKENALKINYTTKKGDISENR